MAAGHAESVYRSSPKLGPVAICDKMNAPRWHEVWEGNPAIAKPPITYKARRVRNATGCRPYIKYPFTRNTPCRFTGWRARDYVGRIYLTDAEAAWADSVRTFNGRYVVIEPSANTQNNPNKVWMWDRWIAVIQQFRDRVPFVQPVHKTSVVAPGVIPVKCGYRHAAALISRSVMYVGTEGGLHHAAAALDRAAVVIFGGFIKSQITGYPIHHNIEDGGPACGRYTPCTHCREAMERITVDQVASAVNTQLQAVGL